METAGYFDWQAAYGHMHDRFPATRERPVVGITGNFGDKGCELAEGYYASVLAAGAVPMVIPPFEDRDALAATLETVDGLLLSGGGDLNPLFLGEEPVPELHGINARRDLAELLLTRLAYDRQIPILGICRGAQVLAAALGGSVCQDIGNRTTEGRPPVKHDQQLDRACASHTVRITGDSLILRPLLGTETIPVNSFHHQAVRNPGPHLRVCATAADGVIEAVESAEHKSILGVQWHPECFILRGDECMMPLFRWLAGEADSFRRAKALHRRILTLDSHCDTPMWFPKGIRFDRRDPNVLVDLHKMSEGRLDAVVMAAYLEQRERTEEAFLAATAKADRILTQIEEMAAANCTAMDIAYTPADLPRLKRDGKKAVMLAIENGYAIGKDLSLLRHFRDRGIVYMTLCHNGDNDICDSARGQGEHGGLSAFGREVVREMNRLGLMVDLSHAAESSFYDALELSNAPALCDVPRNLSDEQLKALAKKGGVAQVTLYKGFLRKDGEATILDAIEHLNHMVNIMGVEHVGIGTDFDGDGGIPGCASASEAINFTRCLMSERYSEADIAGIWGGNFLRVMQAVQDKRQT